MSKPLSEEFLYQYIPMAEQDMMEAMPAEAALEHAFSKRFCRKMKALVKYERRSPAGRFAAAFGRAAAAVLLVAVLLNTILVGSVEAYREKFFEIVQTVTEKFTSFFVESEDAPSNEFVPIEPPYIPEGFEELERFSDENHHTVVFLNDNGQEIYYSQMRSGSGVLYFDTEDASMETLQIMDQEIYVISEDNTIQVYWAEDASEFLIISNFDHDVVLDIAKSIIQNT